MTRHEQARRLHFVSSNSVWNHTGALITRTNSVCDYCEVVSKSNDCSPRYDFKTASDGENNTTDLIEDARLDLTDALLQIKARLLQCTLGTLGDRTGRGVLLVRKCTLSVLYFQVHDD